MAMSKIRAAIVIAKNIMFDASLVLHVCLVQCEQAEFFLMLLFCYFF